MTSGFGLGPFPSVVPMGPSTLSLAQHAQKIEEHIDKVQAQLQCRQHGGLAQHLLVPLEGRVEPLDHLGIIGSVAQEQNDADGAHHLLGNLR